MEVIQRINNNVVLVKKNKQRLIVMGKGIGFKIYPQDLIDEKLIEHTYILEDNIDINYLASSINHVSSRVVMLSNEIIDMGQKKLQTKLNPNILVTLSDHLNFAFKRYEEGIEIKNPLHWEIQQLYKTEMEVGENALRIIAQHTDKVLPDTEIPFIALHFVNAQMKNEEFSTTMEITELIGEIILIIQYHFQTEIDEKSLNFSRFLIHLRYYLIRQMKHEYIPFNDAELINLVKQKYPKEYECAEKISLLLQAQYGGQTTNNEKMYLALHINRVIERCS